MGLLTARQTAIRLLEQMPEESSYEDILRQLRVLQHIEWAMAASLPSQAPEPDAQSAAGVKRRSAPSWLTLAEQSDDECRAPRGSAWLY